jgi:hypothetical protein
MSAGTQDAASGVDLLIRGTPRGEPLAEMAHRAGRQLGRRINRTAFSEGELERRRRLKDPFIENVLRRERITPAGLHGKVQTSPDRLVTDRPTSRNRRKEDRVGPKNLAFDEEASLQQATRPCSKLASRYLQSRRSRPQPTRATLGCRGARFGTFHPENTTQPGRRLKRDPDAYLAAIVAFVASPCPLDLPQRLVSQPVRK